MCCYTGIITVGKELIEKIRGRNKLPEWIENRDFEVQSLNLMIKLNNKNYLMHNVEVSYTACYSIYYELNSPLLV